MSSVAHRDRRVLMSVEKQSEAAVSANEGSASQIH